MEEIKERTIFISLISNHFGQIAELKDILQKILEWLIGKDLKILFLI